MLETETCERVMREYRWFIGSRQRRDLRLKELNEVTVSDATVCYSDEDLGCISH